MKVEIFHQESGSVMQRTNGDKMCGRQQSNSFLSENIVNASHWEY